MTQRTKPDLFVDGNYLTRGMMVDRIGDLTPGQIAQVGIKNIMQWRELKTDIQQSYAHTNFMSETFTYGGRQFAYLYIHKPSPPLKGE